MRIKLVARSLWGYLNQQLCDRNSVWSIKRFWYLYKIELLKKCWQQEVSHETHPYH